VGESDLRQRSFKGVWVPMFCFCGGFGRNCHHLVVSGEEQIVQCGRNRRMNHRLICEGKKLNRLLVRYAYNGKGSTVI
jgi:hypothetical protein